MDFKQYHCLQMRELGEAARQYIFRRNQHIAEIDQINPIYEKILQIHHPHFKIRN